MPSGTSTRLAEVLKRENFVLRDDLQQDKRATLLAIVQMFNDFSVPYVITGGLAVQLYNVDVRPTVDVDVVALREPFEKMKAAQPWGTYGFEMVFDHRRHIKLRHDASNVEVDINVDTRFARLLEAPIIEGVDGLPIAFCPPDQLAFTKLRTQRSDWPRDPRKRIQDRADLLGLLQAHPEIADTLQADPDVTQEMRSILAELVRDIARSTGDELPPEDEE